MNPQRFLSRPLSTTRASSRLLPIALVAATCLMASQRAVAADPYTAMLDALRAELSAKLPTVDDAARKSLIEAKDGKARLAVLGKIPQLEPFLASDALDAKLAKHHILKEATPAGLAAFAGQSAEHRKLIDSLLADEPLMLQMAVADGARPLLVKRAKSPEARYGRTMEILSAIHKASPKSKEGVLGRLALAIALELSETNGESTAETESGTSGGIDPVKRYLNFEKAFADGELDPNFTQLSVWELRLVVTAPESDEVLAWGREMLRNYRPDHITIDNDGLRYVNVVNTDVQYTSMHVGNDKPELAGMQNILMNGGICGRRAFFARYICRAFGIPATARPSTGHGASTRWTPKGWTIVLGPGWGHGTTDTRYGVDMNFLATTQARTRPKDFLKVKRAYWAGDLMDEKPILGEQGNRNPMGFWSAVALTTQRRLIEESKATPLDAVGAELGEANGTTIAQRLKTSEITEEDRRISVAGDGTITIPAVAYNRGKADSEDAEEPSSGVAEMKSFAGGLQVFLPRFFQQQPILVRGGTFKHEANLCESATRHWKGRRPKTSNHMRGLRLAVSPSEGEPQKEMTLELADGVTMEFVYIPPGKFIMGGTREKKEGDVLADTPKHEVTLTRGFYLGKTEVTQAQYAAVMNKEPSKEPDHPADGVKPSRALLMCEELTAKTGMEVRIPSEAEWEYAARAGTTTRWHFGDDPAQLGDYAWFKDNAEGKSHPVGQKKPNPWGLYDMYGNIGEFVRDEHQEDYYAKSPKVDPVGPLMGVSSSMEFTLEAPKAGTYTLSARVVTTQENQSIQLAVNGAPSPITIHLPFTLGKWGDSEPVTIQLNQGSNTLHFWRDLAPQYGVALKSFVLKPAAGK